MQEDKAADFTNNISLRVSVCSNTNTNPSVSNIGQELSLSKTSVVLFIDILLKKPAWYLKINIKKRAALSYYIYAFVNKEKGYLQKIILDNYKEQSPSTNRSGYCFNCNFTLQAFKEFNIYKLYIEGILKKI